VTIPVDRELGKNNSVNNGKSDRGWKSTARNSRTYPPEPSAFGRTLNGIPFRLDLIWMNGRVWGRARRLIDENSR